MIEASCRKCGRYYDVDDRFAGAYIRCPNCGRGTYVPVDVAEPGKWVPQVAEESTRKRRFSLLSLVFDTLVVLTLVVLALAGFASMLVAVALLVSPPTVAEMSGTILFGVILFGAVSIGLCTLFWKGGERFIVSKLRARK